MKKVLHLLLGVALLVLGAAKSHAQTTITVSGSCFDAPFNLTESVTVNGKPSFIGTGNVTGGALPISIFFGPSNDPVWFLSINNQPHFVFEINTPRPPDNSTGGWDKFLNSSACPAGGATLVVGGTGTQAPPGASPTITSFSPSSGPGGTLVTVTGTNLSTIKSVVLRGIPCNITPISATQASFVVPAQASAGQFRLTTTSGTVLSSSSFTVTRASASLNYVLRSSNFNSISVGTFSTVTFTDLDHDGLVDMLVGRETGLVSHYEQSAANSISFTLRSNNLSGLTGHYNSLVSVTDIDGDGLLDMVVGSGGGNFKHYEQSSANSTTFIELSNDFNSVWVDGALTFQVPHFTDIDGDGLLDLLVGDEFLSRYEQTTANGGTFTRLADQNFGPIADAGNGGAQICVIDLDGDGLLDMLVGGANGRLAHYEQASTNSTSFLAISTTFSGLNLSGYTTPAITDLDGDGMLDLVIGGADGVLRHYEQEVVIVNSPPTVLALNNNTVAENVAANTTIGTLSTTDPDAGDTFTYSLVGGTGSTDNAAFNINGSSLRITASPDFETKNSYAVRVRTTDGGGLFFDQQFTISITNVNEAPSASLLSNNTVAENVAANTTVGALSTTDPDAGDTFTYTLVTGTGSTENAAFNISGSSLRITASPDFETKNSYAVRVRTTDAGGLFFDQQFTVNITNVNEAPTIAAQTRSVAETANVGDLVGAPLVASDPDAGTTLTYSITNGNTGGAFAIDGASGQLTVAAALDAQTAPSYALTVQVSDATLTASATVTVNVTDVNQAPTALMLSNNTIAENVAANTTVGALSTTDPDAGDTFTYSLVSGTGSTDNAAFNINGGNLRISASPDFETKNSYAVRVRTTDGGGLFFEQTFTVNITNVNEAPTIAAQTRSVAENSANGTTVGAVTATDPDAGTTLNYSITAGNTGGAFSFAGNALQVANAAALDFETTPTFTLTVQVSDGELTASAAVTVNLTDVDDTAPTVAVASTATGPTSASPIPVSVTFSEPVTGFELADLAVGNGTAGNLSGGGASYTLDITPNGSGTVTVDVPTNAAQDGASNGNVAAPQFSIQFIQLLAPTVTTAAPTAITSASATLGGTVTADGGTTVFDRGVVYRIFDGTPPTIADTKVTIGSGTGSFSQNVALMAGTTYAVRAFATNSVGTSYGTVTQSFTTLATLSIALTGQANVSCFGAADGAITVSASGGNPAYTYSLNPGGSQNSTGEFQNLAAGDYTVTVTDQVNGSASTQTITVTQPDAITFATPNVTNVACFGASTGTLSVTATGGSGMIGYGLVGTSNNVYVSLDGNFTGLPADTYTLSTTDANGCTASGGTLTLTQPPAIDVQVSGNTAVQFGYVANSNCTTLNTSATGGTPGFTYAWTGAPQGPALSVCPTQTTTYTLTVTDAAGCMGMKNVTVTVEDVRGGDNNSGIKMCYQGRAVVVAPYLVPTYQRYGGTVGACPPTNTRISFEAPEKTLTLAVRAFPNPTTGTLLVEVQSPLAGSATFEVLNPMGRAVQQKTQELAEGANEVPFDLTAQPAGNYLIRCRDELGRQAVVRVSKQ